MKKVLGRLDIIIFILFITVFISLTLFFKLQLFIIYSGSMEPHIPKGSVVFTIKPEANNLVTLKKGTIITFHPYKNNPDIYITHRIYKITNKQIQTKGDFNKNIDNWVIKQNQIQGLYLFHIPLIGYGLHFIFLYPWYLLIILGLFYTFPDNDDNIRISWPLLNKIILIFIPLFFIFWSSSAYAQYNSLVYTNNNSFMTDNFYNYVSLYNNINSKDHTPINIQNDVILDFGIVSKLTEFDNVLEIKNISPNPISINLIDSSPYINSWFFNSKKQTIILNPSESTTISLKINPKNTSGNTDYLKLQLNNSYYYKCTIRVNY